LNILYLNNEMTVGGVAKCILKLSKELNKDHHIVIASKKSGALLSEFEKIGIKKYNIIDVSSKLPSRIIMNIKKIIEIVKNENIDVIHSHHRMTTLLAKITSKFINVKVIHTQHLCIEDKFKATGLVLSNIDIITVSDAAKKILVEKCKLNPKRISTIYNTIETKCDNKEIDERLLDLKRKGHFIIAQVSRIVDYKGVYDFVEVAKKTKLEESNIKFILFGDGPEFNNLNEIIRKEGLSDDIYLLGIKNNIIEHLKYIDILILCSYIEGLPLAPLESFSQGIPVIATNIDGTNEEIIDDYNGYLVEMKDIDGFKRKILSIYKNEEKYNRLKENSIKTFNEKFTTKKYVDKHKRLYENIFFNKNEDIK